jgi:UDP-3-O-[3-hydroxymyristoyl] glucosamine N-acyltransferase
MEYDGIPYRVIAPNAEIGEGTVVMPFATIGDGVRIGKGCFIGQGCVINKGAVIGNDVDVGAGTQIGCLVEIGDRCVIDGNCLIGTFQSAICDEEQTGFSECLLSVGADVQIEPMCVVEYGCTKENKTVIKSNCRICVGCYLKAGCAIGEDCTLFPYCYIGNKAILEGNNNITAQTIVGDGALLEKDVCGCNRFLFENYTIYKKNRRIDKTKRPAFRSGEYNFSSRDTFFVTKRG